MTHADLVRRAETWLRNTMNCKIVFTELVTCDEIPDAIGFKGTGSILVECKVSRSDFLKDSKKTFRKHPAWGMGRFRYFMTPPGLLQPADFADYTIEHGLMESSWGLLEVHGHRTRVIRRAQPFIDYHLRDEHHMLVSALRRVQLRIKQPLNTFVKDFIEHEDRLHRSIEHGQINALPCCSDPAEFATHP
jgi:hypothetical protein